MKIKCVKVSDKIKTAMFMWEEGPDNARKKVIRSLTEGEVFDVANIVGHNIISKYPENFEVIHYHEEHKDEKAAASPRNKMVAEKESK